MKIDVGFESYQLIYEDPKELSWLFSLHYIPIDMDVAAVGI